MTFESVPVQYLIRIASQYSKIFSMIHEQKNFALMSHFEGTTALLNKHCFSLSFNLPSNACKIWCSFLAYFQFNDSIHLKI